MTLADLTRACMRLWPVVLVGAIVTVFFAAVVIRPDSLYRSRTEVVFVAPVSTHNPNELTTSSESLIIMAGAVAKRINGPHTDLDYNNPSANPVGSHESDAQTWIRLLNTGTQWVPIYDDQILLVDAVGSTPAEVTQRIDDAVALIQSELTALQREQGSDPIDDIKIRVSPAVPAVVEVDGSRIRAVGMTLLLGLGGTLAVVVVNEVLRLQRDGEFAAENGS